MIGRFSEFPLDRRSGDFSIFSNLAGRRFSAVFVRVSKKTYFTPQFTQWMDGVLMPRLLDNHSTISIEVV